MTIIKTIFKKELVDYFNSSIAYVFISLFLIITHVYFFKQLFVYSDINMSSFFQFSPIFLMILLSAISMRIWAEERREGTLLFMFTLPIQFFQIVLGKFFAAMFFFFLILLSTTPLVFVVNYVGYPDFGIIFSSYFGLFCLGLCFISVGFVMSSFTRNQLVAFVLTFCLSFLLFFLNSPLFLYILPSFIVPFLTFLSLEFHFNMLIHGMISLQSCLYFLSFIVFFLYLNVVMLKLRKY